MNHIKLLQMYEEAESIANEFIQIAMPGHNSISVEGKYIPKTGIMKIKLVQFCFCLFACSGGAESLVAGGSVWGGAGESAADSWKFGSLSRGKTAKMAVNQYFRGESALNSRQIGALSPIRPNPHLAEPSRITG